MSGPDLAALVDPLIDIARAAGQAALAHYGPRPGTRAKADGSPVTDADEASEAVILAGLAQLTPDIPVVSEERMAGGHAPFPPGPAPRWFWLVDPLDGTKEFIARNGEFSIMIGLVVDQRPVMGVIHQPSSGLIYSGVVGQGAHLHEEGETIPLQVSGRTNVRDMVLVSSRSHRKQIVDTIRRKLRITSESVTGSVGLKVGQIARQLADLYIHPSPGCKEWDLCAPEAVLTAAGGVITDCWGNQLIYNKRDVRAHNGLIASNGQIHEQILETVIEIVEEAGYNEDDGFW